jgi:hypothetical protein
LVGHVSVGAVASRTVTAKEQEAVALAALVAVQVTVVVPTSKIEPDAGTHETLSPPAQEPEAVGVW